MAVFELCLVLFLAMTGHSSATYCVCKDGVSDSILQKNIDYACGAGADCSAILSSGACYNPNTVKDHCNYAVNSYYQKKNQATGSCDFQGSANTVSSLPTTQSSGCIYPTSASGTTPSTSPSTTTPTGSSTTPSPPSVFSLGPGGGTPPNLDNKATMTTLYQNSHLFCSLTLTLSLLFWRLF